MHRRQACAACTGLAACMVEGRGGESEASESVPQFTHEYGRLFKAPPKRDVLRVRGGSPLAEEHGREARPGEYL
jgi:hypothetical protein